VTFLLIHLLPGNPAQMILGPYVTRADEAALEQHMGLRDPLPVQFVTYVWRVLHGDLGESWYTSQPVITDLAQRVPATLELITVSLAISLAIMLPLGIRAATPNESVRGDLVDRLITRLIQLYGLLAGAVPDFFLALILIYVLFVILNIAPGPIGALDIGVTRPTRATGSLLIDSVIAGNYAAFVNYLWHLMLPIATLVFVYGGAALKTTITAMQDIKYSPYMENARAMGLRMSTIRRYAFRNALPPIVTIVGSVYGFLLGGAVLVENVFGLPGVGSYGIHAVVNADYAAVQGFMLFAGLFITFVYFIVDIIHVWSDPRVRL
jgi:ABC-type dipeptide/oligopeptide/nickel transport system permease component